MSPAVLLGCVADDFTGATDLGSTLTREGMRVVQVSGVPPAGTALPDADAVVVALKTRTAPPGEAVAASLAALAWLRGLGNARTYFKYCSTFDSRDDGNIGPVADAMLDALGAPSTVACPAFPETGRTVYRGHLFVGDVLLEHSSMASHPLTPMTESNLVTLLGRQTDRRVGLVGFDIVRRGAPAIGSALAVLEEQGVAYAVVDAIDDADLRAIGEATADLALVTGASGAARGLPDAWRRRGLLGDRVATPAIDAPRGPAVIIVGSASQASRAQVSACAGAPEVVVDPVALAEAPAAREALVARAVSLLGTEPLLVRSANGPDEVARAQAALGRERSAAIVESTLAEVAVAVVGAGARRVIVCGGETSAAVVGALAVPALRIGPDIDPGVPWCEASGEPRLAMALKSGNFGGPDLFARALRMLG